VTALKETKKRLEERFKTGRNTQGRNQKILWRVAEI
jgi:hypothetical protein